jgi:hypothetical protein
MIRVGLCAQFVIGKISNSNTFTGRGGWLYEGMVMTPKSVAEHLLGRAAKGSLFSRDSYTQCVPCNLL